MKKLIYLFVLIGLFSCTQKTAENSTYSNFISDLNGYNSDIDSLYKQLVNYPVDSLVIIRESSSEKYNLAKKAFTTDSIDLNYEEIMQITRGKIVKKLRGIESKYSAILQEYDKTSKQVKTLIPNLIHETLTKKEAQNYYNEERNALLIIRGELSSYIENAQNAFELYPSISFRLDSIINQNDQ